MNPRQFLYLDLMAEAPQTFRAFLPIVVGVTTISPGRAMSLLEKLIEAGYCRLSAQGEFTITDAGHMERRKAQTHAKRTQERAEPGPITPPRTYVNASTPSSQPYTGEVRGYERQTGNASFKSRGF